MTDSITKRIEDENLTFAPSLMTQIPLFPISKPTTSFIRRTNGSISVTIAPAEPESWVYGKIPRVLFLYIQRMITTHDPKVKMGARAVLIDSSFREFCRQTGLTCNPPTLEEIKRTVKNLSQMFVVVSKDVTRPDFDFHASESKKIAERTLTANPVAGGWVMIVFAKDFWDELVSTSVPMDNSVIKQLGKSPRSIDLYLWFRYRLNALRKLHRDILITWDSLYLQFEGTGLPMKTFRKKFKVAIDKLIEICPTYVIRYDSKGVTIPYQENKINWDPSDDELVRVDTTDSEGAYVEGLKEISTPADAREAFNAAARAIGFDL
ncbi:replication protein RepA [Bifidobacterium sp. SO1]|uniref:replication protein RepA n=1 Tax=Bifidobacterium sp. SO1 TaxID=2809029 RepID=UPI001BDC9B93|nr:replication protein RepA [Bifidobacterium sp. SO1]MBT1162763.1 hypothetical protein [Bifidobacterium sp. SO1]